MDTTLLINPVVTPSIIAILATGSVLVAVIRQRSAIVAMLSAARAKLFTRSGFFWSAIAVFMAISVWQAGTFFSISGDLVGFVVPFFLDMVTVILMQAMLESRYRDEHARANMFLFFIIMTCAMSTYANFAIAQNTFDANKMLKNASQPVKDLAPYALASFPLFVIMMSIAAEKVVNVRPLDKLEESEYDADELKRVHLIEIRNKHAIRQVEIEVEKEARLQQFKIQRAGQLAEHKAAMSQIKESTKRSKPTSVPQPQNINLSTNQSKVTSTVQSQNIKSNEQTQDTEFRSQDTDEIEVVSVEPISELQQPNSNLPTPLLAAMPGRSTVAISHASKILNIPESEVKELIVSGALKHPTRSSDVVTVASLRSYLHEQESRQQVPESARS